MSKWVGNEQTIHRRYSFKGDYFTVREQLADEYEVALL